MCEMEEATGVTINQQTKCATKRLREAVFLLSFAACVLSWAFAVGVSLPAYAAGSSAETEIGIMFVEEPRANGQDDDLNTNPNQGGVQNQTGLPQKGVSDGIVPGDQSGSSWLQTTGDAMGKTSGVLAFIAAFAALACLVAARRIGKEGCHVR